MRKQLLLAAATVTASAVIGATAAVFTIRANNRNHTEQVAEFAPKASVHPTSYSADGYPDLTYAAESAVKAVVSVIKTEEVQQSGDMQGIEQFFQFFGMPRRQMPSQQRPQQQMSGGSGVIISADGYIVTNNHVVENASKLKVTLNDGHSYDAKVIGTDPTTDVALIKIEATNLPTIPFGSSENLRLGEWVLAIGSPYELQSTITAGIVSAKARRLGTIPNNFSIESFIQTDAAVNPGNSGGALVNTKGELVGINTVIMSPTGSYAGYSFAVPETIVRKVVIDLKEYGIVQRALLGITYTMIDDNFIEAQGEQTGIKEVGGAYVSEVSPNSAAHEAGIRKGDVITAIDGTNIDTSATLAELIATHRPGDKVAVTLKRGKTMKQSDVVLRNKVGKAELIDKNDMDVFDALGGTFTDISDKAKRQYGINSGVQVTAVKQGGILSRARVQRGYVITHINDKPIRSVADLQQFSEKVTSIDGFYPGGKTISYSMVE